MSILMRKSTWILAERNGEEIMCEWGEIYLGNINENKNTEL